MPDSTQNVKRRNGSKHDKTGCLTCRYRRKKCIPNTFPVCGACKRLNLECFREPALRIVPCSRTSLGQDETQHEETSLSLAQPSDPSLNSLSLHAFGKAESSKRRYAMKFYIDVLAELLTVSQRYNSFLSDFLPMAVESPALADALVAWSSGHLSVYDSAYNITALEARAASLRALAKALTSEDIVSRETNAAASLVLLTSEVCLGDHTKWYNHLIGVQKIIEFTQSPVSVDGIVLCGTEALKQSPEGQWVLRNFAYHDILGSVTLRKPPLIPGHYLEGITDVVDTYLGVGSEILIFISEISCHHTTTLAHGYLSSDEANPDMTNPWSAIEEKIKAWRCPPGTLQALASLAYAYRCAALIHLYRQTLRSLKLPHDIPNWSQHESLMRSLHSKIGAEVCTTLQYVASIPLNDVPESALLFPLFLVGAEATNTSHMEMIRIRLRLMAEKRNFQNIQRALGVLEEIWERRAQGGVGNNRMDWQNIVGQQSDGLLLT